MSKTTWSRYAWSVGGLTATLAIVVYLALGLRHSPVPVARSRRNLLLVSMDTLRADHLSCYGYQRPTSPHIDALAARGTRFANASSTSAWTSPAHASLFTSRYPAQLGIVRYQELEAVDRLAAQERTLAEVLKDAGYDTQAFTGGGFVGPELGFAQGFDEYWSAPAGRQDLRYQLQPTLDWIAGRADQERPFFLFLHFYDCHRAYAPPRAWAKRFVPFPDGSLHERDLCSAHQPPTAAQIAQQVGLYDAEIAYADHQLERVFAALEASGHKEDTLVVFVADHGEEFKDHGACDHIHSVYDELVHVPMILAGPNVPAGKVIDAPVSLVDVAPTLLDLLGLAPEPRMEGDDLTPALRGAEPGRRYEFFESGFLADASVRRGVRSARAKLIFDGADRPIELYDLLADPGERRNLLPTRELAGEREHLQRAFDEWRARMRRQPAPSSAGDHALDSALKERLRALGYAGVL